MASMAQVSAELPNEVYLRDAIRAGKAVPQTMSLKALAGLDVSLQLRVKTDMDHVHRLGGVLDNGYELDRIVLYHDVAAGVYYLADGWHRLKAHKVRQMDAIKAWAIEGDYEDALWYASCTNRVGGLARNKDDIKKAVLALFESNRWWLKSDITISKHVGVSNTAVRKYRCEFATARSLPIPKQLESVSGRLMASVPNRKARGPSRFENLTYPNLAMSLTRAGFHFQSVCGPGASATGLLGIFGCGCLVVSSTLGD